MKKKAITVITILLISLCSFASAAIYQADPQKYDTTLTKWNKIGPVVEPYKGSSLDHTKLFYVYGADYGRFAFFLDPLKSSISSLDKVIVEVRLSAYNTTDSRAESYVQLIVNDVPHETKRVRSFNNEGELYRWDVKNEALISGQKTKVEFVVFKDTDCSNGLCIYGIYQSIVLTDAVKMKVN